MKSKFKTNSKHLENSALYPGWSAARLYDKRADTHAHTHTASFSTSHIFLKQKLLTIVQIFT